ncbi:TonB-dependent receptor [Parabacteroides sp.]
MSRHLQTLFLLVVLSFMFNLSVDAQMTTASMSGKVMFQEEPVIGATVLAVHEPSGTNYGTITNVDGRFSLQGMRTGGPYKVTISYIGYQSAVYSDITLQLGENYSLNVELKESSEALDEVVVTATKTRFNTEKTGATTNISASQITALPTINRSISDIARLSPYASGMSFAGGDGRSTNFTVDGANFNNNFGLSDDLPGGGNPISMDAIEEVQVVIAPFDVRQTNFIGGGINAITKSGTNTFKGTAYTYQYNQNMRGNNIDGEDLGERPQDAKHIYGATLGGPIIKNKLFFFANVEYQKIPTTVVNWHASEDGVANPDEYSSRTSIEDMQKVSDFVRDKYGYNTGSYTDFPADNTNLKLLGRIDWNITDQHKLAVRYNYTKNSAWNATNGSSGNFGQRLSYNRISQYSMAFANSLYSMDNKVSSVSADLNSRFSDKISNQLLFTYSNIQDIRGTNSSPFPFIDIMAGLDDTGNQILEPYMSLGYELFTFNNGVHNKVWNITDNFTYYLGNHKFTGGISFEHQMASNAYMRNGTGYYRYRSLDEFLSGAAPESFALAYGYEGNTTPAAQVAYNQLGIYLQDEWNLSEKFKLTLGIRFDDVMFDNDDLVANKAIDALDFGGRSISTSSWPGAKLQVSPRVGFVWDVMGDKVLKVRGGSGIFMGRLPLVFFTNMPTNTGMIQNLQTVTTTYNKDGSIKTRDPRLDLLKGNMITDVNEMIKTLGFPTEAGDGVVPSSIAGIDPDFKMPQVWKSSIAVDYQLPTPFPFSVTGEFMYTKNINAVMLDNYNIKPNTSWERFNGPDNRYIYPNEYTYIKEVNDACVLTNTSKGYGWTGNITVNANPTENLRAMLAYTHTVAKEVSGMPGSNATSAWTNLMTINGANFADVQNSQYVTPDKVIGSLSYHVPFTNGKVTNGISLNLFYTGYSPSGYSFAYTNDMNGDNSANDLMYIPANDNEIKFKNEADRKDFWNFVDQDSYLKNHKGEYAEAYAARAPWVHRFDFRIAQSFSVPAGKTKNTLEISLDFMNVGNMLNKSWGVMKNMGNSNGGRILKYEGTDDSQTPIFSLWRDKEGKAPTETYTLNRIYSQCWKMQLGIRYIFN